MDIFKTKTFWTGLGAVLTAAGAYASGQADLLGAAQTAFTGLMAIFLRQGLLKLPQG
jgi:hypothetical protein